MPNLPKIFNIFCAVLLPKPHTGLRWQEKKIFFSAGLDNRASDDYLFFNKISKKHKDSHW